MKDSPTRQARQQQKNAAAGNCLHHKNRPIYKAQMCKECYARVRASLDKLRVGKPYLSPFGRLIKPDHGLTPRQKSEICQSIIDGTAQEKLIQATHTPNKVDTC